MDDAAKRLEDRDFQLMLQRRSRWRWGLSGSLILAYFIYAIGGLYLSEAYAAPFLGSSLPWGLAIGFAIIFGSIVLSMVYVRAINKLELRERSDAGTRQ